MPETELVLCDGYRGIVAFAKEELSRLRERDVLGPARTVVLVPTAAAGNLLRDPVEDALLSRFPAAALPTLTTPSGLVSLLAFRSGGRVRLADLLLREALLERAFQTVQEKGVHPPFAVRGSLASRVLDLNDELLSAGNAGPGLASFFDRALEELDDPDDEGALKLAQQTRFLRASLAEYREALGSLGELDPPGARLALKSERSPFDRVLIVGSETATPADLELLSHLPGIRRITLAADASSDRGSTIASRFASVRSFDGGEGRRPRLLAPSGDEICFVARDREESLLDVARFLKLLEDEGRLPPLRRVAVVVPRPLPYLYLTKKVFGEAGIPFELQDSFPLASEPYLAAMDVVLELASGGASREQALALLRSPFFVFDGVDPGAVAAFDALTLRYQEPGGFERWRRLLGRLGRPAIQPTLPGLDPSGIESRALPAVAALVGAGDALAELRGGGPLTRKVVCLRETLETFGRPLGEIFPEDPDGEERRRAERTKAALDDILDRLEASARRVGDSGIAPERFREKLRRAVEAHTFAERKGTSGVRIVDPRSAPFGSFDLVVLVALNEGEWPARPERNIFYPLSLLREFGFPSERERLVSERSAFEELLALSSKHVALFRHQLDDEVPTVPSPFLEDARSFFGERSVERLATSSPLGELVVTRSDALKRGLVSPDSGPPLRQRAGEVAGPLNVPEPISPTSFEMYLRCPFKYFSRYLLGLDEEEEVEEALTPLERGRILHELLEEAFREWDGGSGGKAPRPVEPETYDEALALFRRIAMRKIPPEHRPVELERLFGGAGEPGAVPWLLRREMSEDAPRKRLLEHAFESPLRLDEGPRGERPWYVRIKGRVDRADVDAAGRLHVFDYKSGRAPAEKIALQVPLYAMCLAQELGAPVREAAYLSFRDRKARARADFEGAAAALVRSYGAIQSGRLAPHPHQDHLCNSCGYLGVCRKEIAPLESER